MKKAQCFLLTIVLAINLITFPVFAEEIFSGREMLFGNEFDSLDEVDSQRGYTSVTVENGTAQFAYNQGTSNYMYSGTFEVAAEECDLIAIRLKSEADMDTAKFYYMTDEEPDASSDKVINFSVAASEDWQVITLQPLNEPKWTGTVNRYRFTFDKQNANTVEIDYVRFYSVDSEGDVQWPQVDELYPQRQLLRSNEFNSMSELDVWRDGYNSVVVKDGYAQFSYKQGASNYTYSGTFSIPADACDTVAIRVKSDVDLSAVNFYYMTDSEPNASETKVINFAVPASEDWQLITLDTSDEARWKGNITRYRFSFAAPSDNTVKIDFVRFYSKVFPAYTEDERQISYDFDSLNEADGFLGNENVADAVASESKLWAKVVGADSYFTSEDEYEADCEDIPRIHIAYENNTDGTQGKLYFATEETPDFTEECSFVFEISENSPVDCVIDTVENPNWNGKITGLRFVPSDGEGYVKIDFLRLEKFPCEIVVRNGNVEISGNLYGMAGKTLYFSVCDDAGEVYSGEAQTDDNGGYILSFEIPDSSLEPATYNLEVSGGGIEGAYKKEFVYVSADYVTYVLEQINEAKDNADWEEVQSLVENNYGVLSLQCEFFEEFSAKGLYFDELYNLVMNDEEVETLTDLEEQLDEAVVSVLINHMTQAEWIEAVDKYDEYLNLKTLAIYEVYSKATDSVKAEIAKRMSDSNYDNFDEARFEFREQNILVGLRRAVGWKDVRAIIDANADFIGIDLDKLDKVKSESDVYRRLTEKNFSKIEEVEAAFADAIEAQLDKEKKPTSSGGSGGSGGSGFGGGAASVNAPVTNLNNFQKEEASVDVFADLSGYAWAKEAVEALYAEKVVNGLGNGRFAPSNSVTREEFVKMLVLKKKLTLSNDVTFGDVAKDMWYAPYIGAAVTAGITNGQGNTFGVGQLLTRQDAAVMLARAFGADGDFGAVTFTDESEIENYAAEAVSLLTQAGVFTGYEDGSFRPNASLSRAEAAVIIFRINERN